VSAFRYINVAVALGHTERLDKPVVRKAIEQAKQDQLTTTTTQGVIDAETESNGK
jgi:hypothetical protein